MINVVEYDIKSRQPRDTERDVLMCDEPMSLTGCHVTLSHSASSFLSSQHSCQKHHRRSARALAEIKGLRLNVNNVNRSFNLNKLAESN